MFRNLIPALADEFHLVAPDYPVLRPELVPGQGRVRLHLRALLRDRSDGSWTRSGSARFSIYVQDYGAPIGLRIASRHPERVQALIVQNGNAYMDGFTPLWEPLFAYAGNRNSETEAPVRGLLDLRGDQVAVDARDARPEAASHRRPGRSTRTTSTAAATATSNSTSSTTTGSTSRSTRSSSTTSASISRRH